MNSRVSAYLGAVVFSLAVTYGLFSVMYYLINQGDRKADLVHSATPVFDFIRLKPRAEEPETRKRRPEPPPEARRKPKITPPKKYYTQVNPNLENLAIHLPQTLDIHNGMGFALSGAREVAPLVRVQPIYPLHARRRGVEGWVTVEFAIAEDGSVVNPVIVDAEPRGVFDAATIKAVSKWRYQPQVIDGEPIMRSGIRVVIEYQLEK